MAQGYAAGCWPKVGLRLGSGLEAVDVPTGREVRTLDEVHVVRGEVAAGTTVTAGLGRHAGPVVPADHDRVAEAAGGAAAAVLVVAALEAECLVVAVHLPRATHVQTMV